MQFFPSPTSSNFSWEINYLDRSLALDYSELLVTPIGSAKFRRALSRASYQCLLAVRDTLADGFCDEPTRLQRVELAISALEQSVENKMRSLCVKNSDLNLSNSEINFDSD